VGALARWKLDLRAVRTLLYRAPTPRERGLRYAATVMAGGFYGSGNDPSQWTPPDWAGGAFYRATWAGARATNADLAILTSYSARVEPTDIQPHPEWADQYLALTATLSNEWRST